MRFKAFTHATATIGPQEPRVGGGKTRERVLRAVCIALAAGWLSVLPNPGGGAPVPQAPAANPPGPDAAPHFAIPLCLLDEHAELYSGLDTASQLPGETGASARRVMVLLKPHMEKEQLRLLPMLETGPVEPWMTELLPLADQLRAKLPELRREHAQILAALETLRTEAWAEQHSEYAFLALRVKHHIEVEEHILYPAAVITAEYMRLRKES